LLNQKGAAPVEAAFGLLLLVTVAVSIVQVILVVYARNVMAAAAHEGARMAVERHRDPQTSIDMVSELVANATGRLVEDLGVAVEVVGRRLHVRVTGTVDAIGPLPVGIWIEGDASALLFEDP
jgi:Flp pilus assembly protein TadG